VLVLFLEDQKNNHIAKKDIFMQSLFSFFFFDLIEKLIKIYANNSFRFLVSDHQDYSVHLADPDMNVDWDYVEQVVKILILFI